MGLIALINDAELLMELMYEKGTSFYKPVPQYENGEEVEPVLYEVVYFSGSRLIHFVGKLSQEQLNTVKNTATVCEEIEVDLQMGEVKVTQR